MVNKLGISDCMQAIIHAGGKGTRLGKKNIPKVMIKIGEKPVLEHQIMLLKRNGITDIILCVKHISGVIKNYFGDGSKFGVKISYSEEDEFLGTAGALKFAEKMIKDDFVLLYGDVMLNLNIGKLVKFHKEKGGLATLVVHKSDHLYDSDVVDIDSNGKVKKFWRPKKDEKFKNLTNAAVFVFNRSILEHIEKNEFLDLSKDILPKIIESSCDVYGYNTPDYIKDMGTVDRLKKVTKDYDDGKIFRKGVFLDRDGVINKEVSFLYEPSQMSLLDGSAEAIKSLNKNGFVIIVVTNQPVVARNMCSEDDIDKIHDKMKKLLSDHGAKVNAVYYCPHHPDKGYPEENPKYKIVCDCRKPAPGMIFAGSNEFSLDPQECFMVGDRTADIKAGENAGCKTILLKTGKAGKDKKYNVKPDFVCKNLHEAAKLIIKTKKVKMRV
ncbi:MAG: HAD-IIIA family hydrolase [Candidatus Aenigmarchaeota archaeon]|nr:HAD-IIIA family hydrolase [Candidatus Aenigmarchaeota archaeon]